MRSRTLRVGKRCAIGVAFALAVAGLVPATASSETGPGVSLPDVASPAGLAAAVESAADDASVATVVEDVVAAALDASVATPAAPPTSPDDAHQEGTAPEPTTPPPPPTEAPTPGDTTVENVDTTSDTPASAAESAPRSESRPSTSPTVAVQMSPTNVNVSVRVASPGDNGSVTQLNVTADSGAIPARTEPASSHEAAERPAAVGAGEQTAAVSPTTLQSASSAPTSNNAWTWQWDCLSIPSFGGMNATDIEGGITPTSWIWNWNCGENSQQYQSGTGDRYQPVNVNVGIRISSPGNDGPVSQANVVVAIDTGILVTPPASLPFSPAIEARPPSIAAPVEQAAPGVEQAAPGASDAPASSGGEVVVIGAPLDVVMLEPEDEFADPMHGTSRDGDVFSAFVGPAEVGFGHGFGHAFAQGVLPAVSGRAEWQAAPRVAIRPWGTPSALRTGGGRQADASAEPAAVKKAAPRWTRSRGIRGSITPQSSGTSVAPASAGSSSSGGLPFILALPFLAAVLDMARRRVLDRVATPSGHRSRVPDDPG